MTDPEALEDRLAEISERILAAAAKAGADEAEVMVVASDSIETTIENSQLHSNQANEETVVGLRVYSGGALGFATANDDGCGGLDELVGEAMAQAAVMPADEYNTLPLPQPVTPVTGLCDDRLVAWGLDDCTRAASVFLQRVRSADGRVRVDSGSVSRSSSLVSLCSSTGTRLTERRAHVSGYLFGMAVEGDQVASSDYDGDVTRDADSFGGLLARAGDRFVEKCVGSLGAGRGRSYRGAAILSPEAVGEFLLPALTQAISADSVRKGKSPLAGRLGEMVAAPEFTLVDDGSLAGGLASSAFDREGVPVTRHELIGRGRLQSFLFNHYEARAAGCNSTGNAAGSASSLPSISPNRLEIEAGPASYQDMCEPDRDDTILVGRWSGSTNPITGDFSGVVKNSFAVGRQGRRPITEVMMAGNIYTALANISAISSERRLLGGTRLLPAIRLEDVSVTAA